LAVEKLETSCTKFVEAHSDFLSGDDFESLIELAQKELDIQQCAEVLLTGIREVIRIKDKSNEISKRKVLPRVGHFLVQLIPIARLSLGVASTIADASSTVFLTDCKGAGFTPIKFVANGLGIILQVTL
jgi:hypothetical protein